jgi:manganese/zinc/iron transport system substrate-binding protein
MRTYLFISIINVSIVLCLWSYRSQKSAIEPHLRIVCTTSILADTVRNLVDDHVQVISLMGYGIDPHLYKAREGDMHTLFKADIIFYHGLHLEGKMADILSAMNRYKKSIAVSDSVNNSLLQKSPLFDSHDPHIWHDVQLWMYVVNYIRDILTSYDSAHADIYKQKSKQYIKELQELDNYVKKQSNLLSNNQRILVTAHDAFGYFAKAYGFRVIGLQGISTDSDISTKDIQDLVDFIIKHQVRAIFVESSIPQRSLCALQNAVKARGWQVAIGGELYSDALGDLQTHAHTYCGMIQYNIDTIVAALKEDYGTSS